ncbi:MAG: PilZ domain-containing protein [Chromatiales bacterium]|nr:PilZ domain-containing protein [Chromatiales bacterium]
MNIKHADLIDRIVSTVEKTLETKLSSFEQSRLHQALMKSIDAPPWGHSSPQSKQLTILLSDLRGFTALSECHPPEVVIELLNSYFTPMCEIIYRFGGTIDKFMGDSVMALFGLPESREDDLARAIACAVEMQKAILDINAQNSLRGYPRLFMGIGINTGEVIAGELGSELHHEYTVIGDEVNLACRIEAYSLRGQILLSEHSRQLAASYVTCGPANRVVVKGKETPVNLYELLATTTPRYLEVPRMDARKSPRIEVDFPITFQILADKVVPQEHHEGRAVNLSYHGLHAYLPVNLHSLSDIRITLSTSLMSKQSSYIYAKVLDSQPEEEGWLSRMEFTRIDDSGQAAIKNYIDQVVSQK